MLRAGLALLSLLFSALVPLAPALAQDKPESGLDANEICDGLLSTDAGQRDRAALELNLVTAKRSEDVGREILRRPLIEARKLLERVGESTGQHAVVAAMVALESPEAEVRAVAFEAMVEAPVAAVRVCSNSYLKNKRRTNLKEMLRDQGMLRPICEGVPEDGNGVPKPSIEAGLHLAILADCCFGSEGFLGLLRTLGELMIGEEPIEAEASGEDKLKREEIRAQRERLRRQSAAVFEAVWLAAPGAQFNYVANAPIEDRRKAVARLNARLDEMQNREIELGDAKVKGMRLGDYLVSLFSSDVSETVAAAYLRLQWWKGDNVPVEGVEYGEKVEAINALGRRERMALRTELKRWWETYRADTEQK